MTIRLRLTLIYSAILALTLLIFGIALYTIQSQDTLKSLKYDLVISSNKFVDPLLATNLLIPMPPSEKNPPPPRTFNQFSDEQAFQNLREREIVRVLDPFGNLIASPFGQAEDALYLSDAGLSALQSQQDVFEISAESGENMLIYSRPILNGDEVMYIIQVARSLTERDRTLQSLATTLTTIGLVTILAAFCVGWVFSGLSLRPIDRITQTAKTIGEERDFTRRVEHTGKQDEVGHLAETFNQMLARLQDAYQKVESSLKQQQLFVSDVSHELRTPLTTLRGNLGLMLHQPPVEEQQDILTDMIDESDRMIRLVNELLLLAHADAKRNLVQEDVFLRPLIEEVVRQVHPLDHKRVFKIEVSPELTILGERDAIKQVLLILVDNAMKYSQQEIQISAQKLDDQVAIHIQDHGAGIPAEAINNVLDRFYRAEDHPSATGFGLGLPIAKSLMGKMGGQIFINSQVGEGSTVTVIFPNVEMTGV